MSNQEMLPIGRTPRAMCFSCYNEWQAIVEATGRCLMCGGALEGWRLNGFYRNQKEVSNRIHDGQCKEYFSILSVKALGHSTGLWDDSYGYVPQYQIPQPIQDEQSYIPQEDYIDVGFEEIKSMKKDVLNAIHSANARLKPMGLSIPTPEMDNQKPIKETHRGKPVKLLSKIFGSK